MSQQSLPPEIPLPFQLSRMITSLWVPQAIYTAAALGVADALADGPRARATRRGPSAPIPARCIGSCARSSPWSCARSPTTAPSRSPRSAPACAPDAATPCARGRCSWAARCAGDRGADSSSACAPASRAAARRLASTFDPRDAPGGGGRLRPVDGRAHRHLAARSPGLRLLRHPHAGRRRRRLRRAAAADPAAVPRHARHRLRPAALPRGCAPRLREDAASPTAASSSAAASSKRSRPRAPTPTS